jgi:hypothetical protein
MSTNNPTSTTPWALSHRGGIRRMFVVVALALVALLFPLSAPAAHADPPKVMASENPVFVPYSTDTKTIQLTWNLEAWQPLATLTVTESGTPAPVFDQTVSSLQGQFVPLTVTYGKTYTAQLKDVITQQPLGAPLTITTDRLDIKIDMGCVAQCITDVDVQPHGGWAQFTIKTNETAVMTLEASKTKPNANGTWSNPKDVAASNATILPTQNWSPPLPNLDSNTTYYYVVRAHDTNGNEQIKTGSFKTLTRRVDVTFAEIEMIDDSDGAMAGDCDCFFYFNAGNVEPKTYGSFENPKSIASDTTVHPNVTFTIANAPSEIRIRAQGNDNDTEENEFCPAQTGPPEAFTGAANWKSSGNFQECLEWAGDQVLVSVSRQGSQAAPGDVDEQFTEPFTISVGGELVYKVHGTYKVTYL